MHKHFGFEHIQVLVFQVGYSRLSNYLKLHRPLELIQKHLLRDELSQSIRISAGLSHPKKISAIILHFMRN